MPDSESHPTPVSGIPGLAERLFREESSKLVSVLTGIFGFNRLEMAEDVVQEALVRAMQTWPFYGIPKNPAAWLMQTAKHLALDLIRREKLFRDKEAQITATIEQRLAEPGEAEAPAFDDEIKDDRLRLIFACCHSLMPQEAQTALALKTLCGLSPGEIANAFLTTEAAIAKRLTRARQRIQELRIPFEIPAGEELSVRLDSVLQVLYLLFNEGYKASSGESLVRAELCHEAIRLAKLVAEHPAVNQPRTHALLALMLLNTARLSARTDPAGNILRLDEQDRTAWDRPLIALGIYHLGQAAAGDDVSEYHLQAGIAACHCMAADYQSTDWERILALYDRLSQIDSSPIVALNRAVAVAHVCGPAAGMKAVEEIVGRQQLESYYLTHAILGEFEARQRHFPAAAKHFQKARELTDLSFEHSFLSRRIQECETK